MIRKFDSAGAVVCWDSARCSRVPVEGLFASIGHANLIPKVNKLASIEEAAKAVAESAGLYGKGMPTLKYFTLDRSSVGKGVYQELRGSDENEYRFLFSVGVVESSGQPEILKSVLGGIGAGFNSTADRVYAEATGFLQAPDLTKALNALVAKCHGVLLKDGGGTFFVPGEFITIYEQLADGLKAIGPKLHCWQVDLTANHRLVETVNDQMIESILARMEKRQADWKALMERGGKPQERGLESRFNELVEDAQQVEYYEQFLAVRHDKLRAALEAQQAMIGMAHLDLWNAGEVAA